LKREQVPVGRKGKRVEDRSGTIMMEQKGVNLVDGLTQKDTSVRRNTKYVLAVKKKVTMRECALEKIKRKCKR
jgi:hypothetical protein